ncbi:MAG: hypothetical protein FWB84_02040 [Candidatus Bathyarchaeota archaeon]|uniref:hypothetical protein n=1 Tax=Candidatus Bathycorpusculum sp. TaxID=2994959 RepID=UPI00281EBF79|nr:hypothetical protein [Candidatus Termiticorpusculum sp.]
MAKHIPVPLLPAEVFNRLMAKTKQRENESLLSKACCLQDYTKEKEKVYVIGSCFTKKDFTIKN